MSNAEIRARVRRLARELRYQELPELIGQSFVLRSLRTLERELRGALGTLLPANATLKIPDRRSLLGALTKYSILDLAFEVSADPVALLPRMGVKGLKAHGFVEKPDPHAEGEGSDGLLDGLACLEILEDGFHPSAGYLLLFLEGERLPDPGEAEAGGLLRRVAAVLSRDSLPKGYLPRTFTVVDACLTNNKTIWFNKHFYM